MTVRLDGKAPLRTEPSCWMDLDPIILPSGIEPPNGSSFSMEQHQYLLHPSPQMARGVVQEQYLIYASPCLSSPAPNNTIATCPCMHLLPISLSGDTTGKMQGPIWSQPRRKKTPPLPNPTHSPTGTAHEKETAVIQVRQTGCSSGTNGRARR